MDGLGCVTSRPEQANILLRQMGMRCTAKRSTKPTTNLEYDDRGKLLGDEDNAVVSRLPHTKAARSREKKGSGARAGSHAPPRYRPTARWQ